MTPAQILNFVAQGGRLRVVQTTKGPHWGVQKRGKSGKWLEPRLVPAAAGEEAAASMTKTQGLAADYFYTLASKD